VQSKHHIKEMQLISISPLALFQSAQRKAEDEKTVSRESEIPGERCQAPRTLLSPINEHNFTCRNLNGKLITAKRSETDVGGPCHGQNMKIMRSE
jgi:hypothetical protein